MLLYALTLALFSFSATASVVIRKTSMSLSLTRRLNFTGKSTVPELDRARAHSLKRRTRVQSADGDSLYAVQAVNTAVSFTIDVGIGSPATSYTLLVDTGSANTWVGINTHYHETKTSVDTGESVFVEYGSGYFSGEEYFDTIMLGDELTITGQSIGVANASVGLYDVDGILGIGPAILTTNTTAGGGKVPTVTDNAFSQGSLTGYEVGIFFTPASSDAGGEITFGGTNTSKCDGDLNYVPITSTSPANLYVGIDQSIAYGSTRLPILASTAGITDTGTTLIYLASDAFKEYQTVTGAELNDSTGLLSITARQYAALESLYFTIGDVEYEFTANAQIWPRSLNTALGGDEHSIYLVIADIGSVTGEGLDFVNGYTFLERFYTVYNSEVPAFGIATTEYTNADTN